MRDAGRRASRARPRGARRRARSSATAARAPGRACRPSREVDSFAIAEPSGARGGAYVREVAARLDREEESSASLVPSFDRLDARQTIEGRVDLDDIERVRDTSSQRDVGASLGIEDAAPVFVAPSRAADEDHAVMVARPARFIPRLQERIRTPRRHLSPSGLFARALPLHLRRVSLLGRADAAPRTLVDGVRRRVRRRPRARRAGSGEGWSRRERHVRGRREAGTRLPPGAQSVMWVRPYRAARSRPSKYR